jgi:Mrp family chromosome partitioning ATPase
MKSLVEQLTTMSDLVILDSTPLLVVSDSLPLVEFVSGVVAVARLNKTTTDAINRFERVIANAGGTLLGTVASGATGTDAYGYGYGGYALSDRPPNGGSRPRRLWGWSGRKERPEAPEKKLEPRKYIEPTTPEAP